MLTGAGVAQSAVSPTTAPSARMIDLGELPLLFADDSGIAASSGLVRTSHPARTRSAPVIQPDKPWEPGRIYIYGSVYADPATGDLRMWYQSRQDQTTKEGAAHKGMSPTLHGYGFDVVLYATSHDGLTWVKPNLRLYPFNGSLDNNIVFGLGSPSVLIDPFEKDPARRYKMMGSYRGHYYTVSSPDGLKWVDDQPEPPLKSSDTITLTQDPSTGEYLAYHKRPTKVRGFTRRAVWLARSKDFRTWSEPELVFAPDEEDDAWAKGPSQRTEVYNMSVYPHAGGFIGFPTIFRVEKEGTHANLLPGQSRADGPIDVQLATSIDGRTWRRSSPRMSMIPHGAPGTFDAGAILGVSSTPVNAGDETWIYYTALTTTHGAPIPPKRLTIARAEWRRYGFVSLDASNEGGKVRTQPLRLKSPNLVVNADASKGEVRVGLLEMDGKPIEGLGLADAEPLTKNATRWVARWKGNAKPPTDRPVRVEMELKSASLFSISTQP
jgi:hypothetical protein